MPINGEREMIPNEDAIRALFYEAEQNPEKRKALLDNPEVELSYIGVAVPPSSTNDLKVFLEENIGQQVSFVFSANAWPSTRCIVCTTSVWAIAAGIVAVGAAGLATLTAASSIVVALAGWANVAPAIALAFIQSLGTSIAGGVTAVAKKICKWTGFCP